MGKWLVALIVVLFAYAWSLYEVLGVGKTIYNHRPGVCRQVEGPVKGSEDIEVIHTDGIAFVTSGILYLQPHRAHVEGKMFLYDFKQQLGKNQPKATQLPIKGASFDQNNFHPHGISHWVVNGVIRLYVINHSDEFKHSVEIFDYDPSGPALIHKKSIKDKSFIRPNDLVAVGVDQFIFTNDGVTQTEIGNVLETFSGYKGGSAYYWDGKISHALITGVTALNGIVYDKEKNKLIVSDVNNFRINAYELAKDRKSVTPISSIKLYTACDNFYLHTDGTVFGGCHPKLIEAAKSMGDCDGPATSPSQILHIKYDEDYKTATITESYANDGSEVSGSTIGVVYGNQMLIGTVCKNLLHCEVASPSTL